MSTNVGDNNTVENKLSTSTSFADNPKFQMLFTDEVKVLRSIFEKHGYELRIAGGAVRDLLMDKVPKDIDFATTATPDEMKAMFHLENIRMINEKGESHGTVTARILDKSNFEVTTLRIDQVTDGRHAKVVFTTDWKVDAERRDLTINSMFLDLDGNLYDFFNGRDDLAHQRVRFVGDADKRIKEDYLRILRFFRFFGRITSNDDNPEEETLKVIRENADGLTKISGERIWVELGLIAQSQQAANLLRYMFQCKLFPPMGLPSDADCVQKAGSLAELDVRWPTMRKLSPQSATCIASLLATEDEIITLRNRLKFSNSDFNIMNIIVSMREEFHLHGELQFCQHRFLMGLNSKTEIKEMIKYFGKESLLEKFDSWSPPIFPVNGKDLKTHWNLSGPAIGKTLTKLKQLWVERDCVDSKVSLLQHAVDSGSLKSPLISLP